MRGLLNANRTLAAGDMILPTGDLYSLSISLMAHPSCRKSRVTPVGGQAPCFHLPGALSARAQRCPSVGQSGQRRGGRLDLGPEGDYLEASDCSRDGQEGREMHAGATTAPMNPICGCENDPASDPRVISLTRFTVFECQGCGLWYKDRLLSARSREDSLHGHQSESYFSGFPPGYLDSPLSGGEVSLVKTAHSFVSQLRPNASFLLDVGCGGGRFLQFMKENRDLRVVGLEASRFLAEKAGRKGLDIVIGDVQATGFRDGSFDVVTLWDAIEHLPRPLDALDENRRILSPGGVIILSTPNAESILHSFSLRMYGSRSRLLEKPARRVFAGHPLYFSEPCLRQLLARSGLRVVGSWQHGVASEMSFRGGFMETMARILDGSLGRALRRQYRMVIVAKKD